MNNNMNNNMNNFNRNFSNPAAMSNMGGGFNPSMGGFAGNGMGGQFGGGFNNRGGMMGMRGGPGMRGRGGMGNGMMGGMAMGGMPMGGMPGGMGGMPMNMQMGGMPGKKFHDESRKTKLTWTSLVQVQVVSKACSQAISIPLSSNKTKLLVETGKIPTAQSDPDLSKYPKICLFPGTTHWSFMKSENLSLLGLGIVLHLMDCLWRLVVMMMVL
jgi:hypothetical protein